MPVTECASCGAGGTVSFDWLNSGLEHPTECPECLDYGEYFGYHELRRAVSYEGFEVGSNPETTELVEKLKSRYE